MTDLISREAVKAYIDVGHLRSPTEKCFSELDVVRMLDRFPAVDAELVRHGCVIETIENGKFKRIFSCCGTDFTTMTMWMAPRYCPNCGAKMMNEDF